MVELHGEHSESGNTEDGHREDAMITRSRSLLDLLKRKSSTRRSYHKTEPLWKVLVGWVIGDSEGSPSSLEVPHAGGYHSTQNVSAATRVTVTSLAMGSYIGTPKGI